MVEVVEIERMGYGADAIAHASDGKTLFVQGAVAGDVVEVKTVLDKKTYAKAKVTKLISPSPDRVSKLPVDALQSGATWANLSYDLQLRSKRANLARMQSSILCESKRCCAILSHANANGAIGTKWSSLLFVMQRVDSASGHTRWPLATMSLCLALRSLIG